LITAAGERRPLRASEDRGRWIEHAFVEACLLDVLALKPGNVGAHGAGHGMQALDFVRSARAAAPAIAGDAASVGERIHRAIVATRAVVGTNTNLGIVLLAAPLAHAARAVPAPLTHDALSRQLAQVLAGLTVADATLAFQAICLAKPGGLGDAARHDVREPAKGTLLEAMRAAADRDSIARQYVTAFADVAAVGLARLAAACQHGRDLRLATSEVFLAFLSSLPDSHVARKFGQAVAEALRAEACAHGRESPVGVAALRQWDATLKARGLNPGTSADLTVATLFWHLLVKTA
jgi:triphosphoribosyl-dephospho-CoA synthase